MKLKNIFAFILCGAIAAVGCQGDVTSDKMPESPITSFEYTTGEGTFSASIDHETNTISLSDLSYGSEITAVEYELASGVTISPEPSTRIDNWASSTPFILSYGNASAIYKAVIEAPADAVIYAGESYGKKTRVHMYDLKYDLVRMDNLTTAETLFSSVEDGGHGLNGIRFPIWGGIDGDYDTGHPSFGMIQEEVYARFVSRTLNARNAYVAGGGNKNDFTVFISIKSNDHSEQLPKWCYSGNDNTAPLALEGEKYAQLVFDLIKHLKDNDITVNAVGLDNESGVYRVANLNTLPIYIATAKKLNELLTVAGLPIPKYISSDAYDPKVWEGGWLQALVNTGADYYDYYGIHYYPEEHPRYFANLVSDVTNSSSDKAREFWATEPHWNGTSYITNNYDGDILKNAEQAMCTFWSHTDLGLDAFCWWDYNVTTSLRDQLMKITSVPAVGAQPIKIVDSDDVTGLCDVSSDYSLDTDNLRTRAFYNEDSKKLTLYVINMQWWSKREESKTYSDYVIAIDKASITNDTYSYQMWYGTEDAAGGFIASSGTSRATSSNKITINIPARSITCIQLDVELAE